MRRIKGIWRERLYFPMDSLPCTAFLVSLSKTISMNGTSCKGNLTDLRRELHLSLAKGNPK
jgi:hypothetical protein